MNLPLASSLALAGILTSPFLTAAPQEEQPVERAQSRFVKEADVGLSIYVPKQISAKEMLRYSKEMTESQFMLTLADGGVDRRDRLIPMGNAIGIQGTAAKRAQLTALFDDLDARLGALEKAADADVDGSAHDLRTMRMKCMGTESAMKLINSLGLPVSAASVEETGNLILQGPGNALDQVQRILAEADKPLPQLTMHCEIIEAVPPVNPALKPSHSEYQAYHQKHKLLTGDVAEALGTINPGKKFARRAHMLLRSSIGGQRPVEISSAIARAHDDDGDSPTKPRLTFNCIPSAWDPDTQSLTLDDCSVVLEIPTYQLLHTGDGSEPVKQFSGYTQQGISSRLSLKAGETTVIGSLGGDPVYVALRFTVR